jgi:hypothetical protein
MLLVLVSSSVLLQVWCKTSRCCEHRTFWDEMGSTGRDDLRNEPLDAHIVLERLDHRAAQAS